MTHKDGCAVFQGHVPPGRHGDNGDAEVDTESVHTEEAEEGEQGNNVPSSLPEVPRWTQTVVHTSEDHGIQVYRTQKYSNIKVLAHDVTIGMSKADIGAHAVHTQSCIKLIRWQKRELQITIT